jgi:hypothetical protein
MKGCMEVDETITLHPGETHAVRLTGRGSMGYIWTPQLQGAEGVVAVDLQSVGNPPPLSPGNAPNSYSLDRQATIRALAPGRVLLHLFQHRLWEKDLPPLEEHFYEIIVEDT